MKYTVNIDWDSEVGVWFAFCDDIPLATESNSFDALIEKVKNIAYEILPLNNIEATNVSLNFTTMREEILA